MNAADTDRENRQADIDARGDALWTAWNDHVLLDRFPGDGLPPDTRAGYAIQDAMVTASGHPRVGWKVGATNRAAQEMLSLDGPVSGVLLQPFCVPSPAEFPATDFAIRALEPEVAFRMHRGLPARAQPYTADEVADAVASCHPALEVPDTRLAGWDHLGAPAFIADNAAAGRFVLGPAVADWRDRDLAAMPVRLLINDAETARGCGADVLGNPLNVLAWLANHLPSRGAALEAGALVTTGTCTPIRNARAGDRVVADFGDFGSASASFD